MDLDQNHNIETKKKIQQFDWQVQPINWNENADNDKINGAVELITSFWSETNRGELEEEHRNPMRRIQAVVLWSLWKELQLHLLGKTEGKSRFIVEAEDQ